MKSVKPYLATASILVVMMAFQNCGQSGALNSNFTAVDSSSFNKISTEEFSSVVIPDPVNAKALDVDIMSGQVREYSENGISTGKKFCLSEEKRAELEAALKGAEVCQPIEQPANDRQCIMIYRYPYAQLKNASITLSLGEKHHGCEVPVNLCGEKAAEFEGVVAKLLNEIPASSCE